MKTSIVRDANIIGTDDANFGVLRTYNNIITTELFL